jgi:hypothetical protein
VTGNNTIIILNIMFFRVFFWHFPS